jgi:GT2 family glycosyltransferase
VRQIWANTEGVSYEIIIADNGSDPHTISPLRNLGGGARLLELGINRFFGEANNIAAERAAGKYLCFLNNDAFVQPGWLRALVDELAKTPEAGAVGPMLLFPDGAVQEAGGAVDESGYPTRFGRHLDPALPELNVPKFVDYVSAAAMLVEKELFIAAGGFDLAYEPAYYEDSDLCFRFLSLGRKTRYCPAARVIHIEGSSANSDEAAQKRRRELGDLNRGKFLERWGAYLKTRSSQDLPQFQKPAALPAAKAGPVGSAAIVTLFALTPGGGERYILTLAAARACKAARCAVRRPSEDRVFRLHGE